MASGYDNQYGNMIALDREGIDQLRQMNSFGYNMPTMKLGLDGLSSIGSLWATIKGLNQAKREFAFNKSMAETNLRNSTQAYNTELDARARARASAAGNVSGAEVDRYIKQNSLK